MKRLLITAMLILTWGSLGLGVAKAAELSIADVAKHNTAQDCYMAINGKVYDITSYFGSHPGGDSYLLESCGIDATSAFVSKGGEGSDHSRYAYDLLKNYYVSDLAANSSLTASSALAAGPSGNLSVAETKVVTVGFRYPLVFVIGGIWLLLLFFHYLMGKKYGKIFNRGLLMRATSLIMLIAFIMVAAGGLYMTFAGRMVIKGFDTIMIHVYSGFAFAMAAFTHLYLHLRDISIYLKMLFRKKDPS